MYIFLSRGHVEKRDRHEGYKEISQILTGVNLSPFTWPSDKKKHMEGSISEREYAAAGY